MRVIDCMDVVLIQYDGSGTYAVAQGLTRLSVPMILQKLRDTGMGHVAVVVDARSLTDVDWRFVSAMVASTIKVSGPRTKMFGLIEGERLVPIINAALASTGIDFPLHYGVDSLLEMLQKAGFETTALQSALEVAATA